MVHHLGAGASRPTTPALPHAVLVLCVVNAQVVQRRATLFLHSRRAATNSVAGCFQQCAVHADPLALLARRT